MIRCEFIEDAAVILRVHDHRDRRMILRGGAHHGRAADVDVVHGLVVGAVGARHGFGKGVEIDREQVDGLDAVFAHHVFVDAAAAEEPAVNLGVQGLHAASHDLGKPGMVGDFLHSDSVVNQQLRRAARGQQLDASFLQFARELHDPGFVGDAEQGAAH